MNSKNTHFFKRRGGMFSTLLLMAFTAHATNYYVSPTGNDGNSGQLGFPKKTIQAAINVTAPLDVVHVAAGTYNEDININRQITVVGAGYATTTISGPMGGSFATVQVAMAGVIIDSFTITRAGNNVANWNDAATNSAGISIVSANNFAEVRNCNIVGNRNGIDVNGSSNNNIHDNFIDNNRVGLVFTNETNNSTVVRNYIRNNWAIGILFLDGSGGTNSPLQRAANSTFSNNYISGNWYGEVVDRQTDGSLPAPGSNLKNFACNWYGSVSTPVTTAANSGEPDYSVQIPVAYGGTATAPASAPDIAGAASASIAYGTWLAYSTDANFFTPGFQPAAGACVSCSTGDRIQNARTKSFYCKLQDAINDEAFQPGDTIRFAPGIYDDEAVIYKRAVLLGSGFANTTLVGTPAVFPSTIGSSIINLQVVVPGCVIDGFTITREPVNPGNWTNPTVTATAILLDGRGSAPGSAEVSNCRLYGNRTAIDINQSGRNYIHDNIIDNNRNGIIFRNRSDTNTVENNFITNNWTIGILFNEPASLTNPHSMNCRFNNNVITGNWYGDVVDRQSTAIYPAPGTTNSKDFSCNWFGSAAPPTVSASNATEPAYAAQIPIQYGGSAVPPGGQPNILGPASANILHTPWLTNGTDADPVAMGFQPVPNSCIGNSNPPMLICPPDKTVSCGESILPSNTGIATAPPNCGQTSVTFSDSPTPPCRCNYAFIRTWKAVDLCGNQNTCRQNITVSGPPLTCSINVTPGNTIYTGGVPTNLYFGYGPQSATLNVTATSGSDFTYVWSGPTGSLSCTDCANPVFAPTSVGNYTFTITVTNGYGCTTSCSVTFCVKDVRDPNHDNKVYVCHGGSSSSISVNAVPAHLGNHTGDKLGKCDQTCGSVVPARLAGAQATKEFQVYPNPNNGSFVVQLPDAGTQAFIVVSDVQGKVILKKNTSGQDGSQINLNLNGASHGVYFIEVMQGDQRFRTKLLIQ